MLESFHRLPIHSGDRGSGWMIAIAEPNLIPKQHYQPKIFHMSNHYKTHASTGQNPNLARGNYPLSINTRYWAFFWLKKKQ
ncbi:hypothetical protein Lfee_0137 [Legionella feeleii]|uniref:Uncharacterized protein n=1 Tax=Legionella feeleii TaxID=453 RepID=A0A0W0UAC5_9GAMM|nr:hypothetical protein Lfee_0137 [Legionella feeleii]SPX61914.1 Uncharacterised protein [Legionella feeleii]